MICRKTRLSALPVALLAGIATLPATSAQAMPAPALLPLATVGVIDLSCGITLAAASPAPAQIDNSMSKSSAILSGRMSALDRIRLQQQAGLADAPATPLTTRSRTALEQTAACPVAGPATSFVVQPTILKRSINQPVAQRQLAIATNSEDFLATRRIAIGKTPFDRQWHRVAQARLSGRQVRAAMGSRPASGIDTLARVNAWVNDEVRHVDDRVARRVADHWASASQTLSRRAGDCEDFAILKYQMLAALGVAREDMYLTLARDLVRNADHAVLIVKHEGRYYMLDNATSQLLDASTSHDYRATMSFTAGRTFLHGALQPA